MSKAKLLTFLAEEEHFSSQDGFIQLLRRIQHFNLEEFGVIIIKVPESVTIEQRKKLVPLLEEIKLNEFNRQKSSFVATDFYSLARTRDPTPEDLEYVKRKFTWKQWQKKHGNNYLTSPEDFWQFLLEKQNADKAIHYGVAVPGTLIADSKYQSFYFDTAQPTPFSYRRPNSVIRIFGFYVLFCFGKSSASILI